MTHLILQSRHKNELSSLQKYNWDLQQMIKIRKKNNFCILSEQERFILAMNFSLCRFHPSKKCLHKLSKAQLSPGTSTRVTYLVKVSEISCLFIWKFFQPSGSLARSLLKNQPTSSENLKQIKASDYPPFPINLLAFEVFFYSTNP